MCDRTADQHSTVVAAANNNNLMYLLDDDDHNQQLAIYNYVNQSQNLGDAILNYLNENKRSFDACTLLEHVKEMIMYHKRAQDPESKSSSSSLSKTDGSCTLNPSIIVNNTETIPGTAVVTPNTMRFSQQQPEVSLYIKPVRKTANFFLSNIPPKLFCSPYKYDLMLSVPTAVNEAYDFVFNLLDSESRETITKNSKGEEAFCVERTKTQRKNFLKPGFVNATFRLNFSICSFHNSRKPFLLCVYLRDKSKANQNIHNIGMIGGNGNSFESSGDQLLLISDPFSIFARKTGQSVDDDWGLSPLSSSSSNSSINCATSSSSSEEDQDECVDKKKKKKEGIKRKRRDDDGQSKKKTVESSLTSKQQQPEPTINQQDDITARLASDYDQMVETEEGLVLSTSNCATNVSITVNENTTDCDQWSQFFETPDIVPEIAPFLEEEIVTSQQEQPSAIYQQYGAQLFAHQHQPTSATSDLSLLIYQELLKQFRSPNNHQNAAQLPSCISPPQQTQQSTFCTTPAKTNWSLDHQTLRNTTTESIDLGGLILSMKNNPNSNPTTTQQATLWREQQNGDNNLVLDLDESLYSKLFGSTYNPNNNNYFFNK